MMDDVLKGSRAVKAKGDHYLPMLLEQEPDSYERYKQRAVFVDVTKRARDAMMGFLFIKPVEVKVPSRTVKPAQGAPETAKPTEQPTNPILQKFVEDSTMRSRSFPDFIGDVTDQVVGMGRRGTLVEWSNEENRPYAVDYAACDIINWQHRRINGKVLLSRVVLKERDRTFIPIGDGEQATDQYKQRYYDQWRELELLDDGRGNTFYQVTVWRRKKRTSKTKADGGLKGTGPAPGVGVDAEGGFVPVASFVPVRRDEPLAEIPFVFHGTDGPQSKVTPPPLEGLAEINLSMYRTSADLENARHVCGVPTPWAAGFSDKKEDLVLSSDYGWVTTEVGASCGFLTLGSEGLAELREAIKEKVEQAAALGARMLDTQRTTGDGAEAYETVRLRQSGEHATLSSISDSLSQSMTDVLSIALWWSSPNSVATFEDAEKQVMVRLTTEFVSQKMDGATLQSLVSAFLQNAMSFEALFWNLKRGELLPPDATVEDEKAKIEEGQSMLMPKILPEPTNTGERGNKKQGGNEGEEES